MRDGIRIGRLFGIQLSIDPSWLLIFFLLTWNLTSLFGTWHPEWRAGNVAVAVVASILFFASVVAHELAHAVVALSYGMRVRGIRLFLFGGVSDIEREPPSPKAEFWMAIVGPLMSFGLGVASWLVARLLVAGGSGVELSDDPVAAARSMGPVATLLAWLAPVNMMVGLFNLIPGFPLDGGRVLRAGLWALTKNLHKATSWASGVGRAVGWAFIALGIMMAFGARVPFFGQGFASGLWLVFIGWFLSSAAARSYEGLLVDEALADVHVEQLMRRGGWSMPAATSISDAVHRWFMRSSERMFPVFEEDERFIGLVRLEDAAKAPPEEWTRRPVADIVAPLETMPTLSAQDDAATALRRLAEFDAEQLPVVSNGRFVGVLDRSAIARWLEVFTAARQRTAAGHAT